MHTNYKKLQIVSIYEPSEVLQLYIVYSIYSNHIFVFVAAIIHFKNFIYKFYVLILYSFVLASS